MEREAVAAWIDAYERAWRAPGTEALVDLFSPDAAYLVSPWAEPISGLDALSTFWTAGRDSADEVFAMTSTIVAVDGDTAVARVSVDYGEPVDDRWLDLWIIRFDGTGRCSAFEEWPIAPAQPDGH